VAAPSCNFPQMPHRGHCSPKARRGPELPSATGKLPLKLQSGKLQGGYDIICLMVKPPLFGLKPGNKRREMTAGCFRFSGEGGTPFCYRRRQPHRYGRTGWCP
jgi:hypothetical protein